MTRHIRMSPGDNYTGLVYVTRCGFAPVAFESMLEMDWVIQTDARHFGLRHVHSQPDSIKYWFDGRMRRWTPDFLMREISDNRPKLVEVKTLRALYPKDALKREMIKAKFAAIERAAYAHGFGFVLATENEIRVQPRLYNSELMTGAVYRDYPMSRYRDGLGALARLPRASSVPALQKELRGGHDAFGVALYLAWRGLIRLDPAVRWSHDTAFIKTDRCLS